MKISYNWLKDYIDHDYTPTELGEILTALGLEVEGMEVVESVKGGLKGIIVGHVLSKEKHPNADRLSLTKVDVGGELPLSIVCGAPNVAAGQKVLVATEGTTLYDKEDKPWKIKKGKIRGEVSEGMICAEDELGLGESHDGIIVLPDDIEIGTSAASYFKIKSDHVYDIGLTPNRSDATGHLGVASDLLAYMRVNKDPSLNLKRPEIKMSDNESSMPMTIEVKDTKLCPRYSGLCIDEVKIGPSPQWMQDRLKAIDVRPINNVVDITNYVLHEYGQPLHAFDYQKIKGQKIIVQCLEDGTKFTTLDEVERELSEEDLMICNSHGEGMCIAGVFGGIDSGVTDATTQIFLESAHFNAVNTRKTSTRHLLQTDAARCFEKGSDPSITLDAMNRAMDLLAQYADARRGPSFDIYPDTIERRQIDIDFDSVRRLSGVDFSGETIQSILTAMDMTIMASDKNGLTVQVPTNKADVLREADIVEEILRVYGFDNVATSGLHQYEVKPSEGKPRHVSLDKISDFLSANGFHEIMGLSLMNDHYFKDSSFDESRLVYINNTSNVHLNVMRPDMVLSGLESVAYNLNRQQSDVKLYETGRAYHHLESDYEERHEMTIFLTGDYLPEHWQNQNNRAVDFYYLRSVVDSALRRMGIEGCKTDDVKSDIFDIGMTYMRGPIVVAEFGNVDAKWRKVFGIKTEVYAARISLDAVLRMQKIDIRVSGISKYPSMRRDLALVIDEQVKYEDIARIARKIGGKMLKDIDLFDIYTDAERLGEGKKSYAVKMNFSDAQKTLTDEEIDGTLERMIEGLNEQLGAVIRR